MTRKFCCALALAFCLGVLPLARPLMLAQAAGEKNTPQKSAPEKKAPEKSASEQSAPEKSTPDWGQPTLKAVELQPSSVPITLHLEGDSRLIYEGICKQAGIKVLFDPDYTSRAIRVEINKVSLQDALTIVAAESRTFWRAVTSDTILVAQDSQAKRRELEQSILKTFYLPNISQPTDLQDTVNALRTLLEISRVQQLPSQNTIMVRGSPSQIAMSEKLIDVIEKAKKQFGEYRLEFKISELEGAKKLNSRTYTFLIEQHETGKLRVGTKIPIQVSADASPDKRQVQYIDVGQNIDCQVRTESEHAIGLNLDADFSNFAMSEQLSGENTAHSSTPVLQQFRITSRATLELGKPTIISSFDDPSSKHTFQIEVTATRIRERE
jgi:type II secretory pathway component GspD/PulD (secretin)